MRKLGCAASSGCCVCPAYLQQTQIVWQQCLSMGVDQATSPLLHEAGHHNQNRIIMTTKMTTMDATSIQALPFCRKGSLLAAFFDSSLAIF